jgi:hypothetical protein
VQRMRRPDDPQRELLQMRKLRRDQRVQLAASLTRRPQRRCSCPSTRTTL